VHRPLLVPLARRRRTLTSSSLMVRPGWSLEVDATGSAAPLVLDRSSSSLTAIDSSSARRGGEGVRGEPSSSPLDRDAPLCLALAPRLPFLPLERHQ